VDGEREVVRASVDGDKVKILPTLTVLWICLQVMQLEFATYTASRPDTLKATN
jgi:hypothetical protein